MPSWSALTPTRDHPRSRGVYDVTRWPGRVPLWIIPARAGFTAPCAPDPSSTKDHPRSRGVYSGLTAMRSPSPGSSPLARGLRPRGHLLCRRGRIIPARAGFTRLNPAAHQLCPGSSPLARGLRAIGAQNRSYARIIPARAGFTLRHTLSCQAVEDHPRSRGVYSWPARRYFGREGSSPLARGLRAVAWGLVVIGGIIPARAGFTRRGGRAGTRPSDHPRSRGVYTSAPVVAVAPAGSSPLARGLRGRCSAPPAAPRDHPRSRGVYSRSPALSPTGSGSSPLARGLRLSSPTAPGTRWIIPARAGFTLPGHDGWTVCQDHPRSRGVYRPLMEQVWREKGSSPLARGLPPVLARPGSVVRIIPARAGFTARNVPE